MWSLIYDDVRERNTDYVARKRFPLARELGLRMYSEESGAWKVRGIFVVPFLNLVILVNYGWVGRFCRGE